MNRPAIYTSAASGRTMPVTVVGCDTAWGGGRELGKTYHAVVAGDGYVYPRGYHLQASPSRLTWVS